MSAGGNGRPTAMPVPASSFTNPATATTYRLVVVGDGWRITKARQDDGRLRLVHLRGCTGTDPVDGAAVARLVAGKGGVLERASCPAVVVFTAVILRDLEDTADVLVAIAREAASVYEVGCRGFRPRSPLLRRQRDAATHRAAAECRSMAQAWQASGLEAVGTLPEWLTAALADGD